MSDERLEAIANEYEQLVNNGSLVWVPVVKEDLDKSTVRYIEYFLEPSGLKYWVAEQRIDNTVLFKIDHPTVCYLHHDPVSEQHMWAGEGFNDGLSNNVALATLAVSAGVPLPHRVIKDLFDELDSRAKA